MICSFCRYANWEKGVKCCRNCKAELIRYIPLSKHEEDWWYRENLKNCFIARLRPRITSQERREREILNGRNQLAEVFGMMINNLNSSALYNCG